MTAVCGAALLAGLAPHPAAGESQPGSTVLYRGAWSIDGRDVKRVEVRLARGSVIARGSDRTDIVLRTVQRSSTVDPRVVEMRTSNANGVVRIVAFHPADHVGLEPECLQIDEELGDFWHHDVTVDVDLAIPRRTALTLRTMVGDAEVTGLGGRSMRRPTAEISGCRAWGAT